MKSAAGDVLTRLCFLIPSMILRTPRWFVVQEEIKTCDLPSLAILIYIWPKFFLFSVISNVAVRPLLDLWTVGPMFQLLPLSHTVMITRALLSML